MDKVVFGQYYPTDSVIHRMDPRIKLLAVILYIVTVFFLVDYVMYAAIFLFVIAVSLVAMIPFKVLLRTVRTIIFLVLITSIINLFFTTGEELWVEWKFIKIYREGVEHAIKLALRLILLMLFPSLLTLTTTPMELTDALESLMSPLKLIKIPVHAIALIMSIALRMIPILMEETNKIMLAQKARGADFDTGGALKKAKAMIPVLVPLFVGAFRRADELALAMDARCYSSVAKRTKYKVMKLTLKDLVASLVCLSVFALVFLNKYLWAFDSMIVSLFQ
ncbi:MAG: energy-coupling factor transporter transmembrane protein EcfT [Clostridia bacterium]|nr:energy-coupling factor transporter transmembrane protein EcfT [Clostridia bacterium]